MKSKKIKDPGVLIYDAVCAAICLVCVILSIVGLFTETGETELLRHKYNLGESLGAVALIIAVALIRRKLFNFPRVVEIVVVFLILAGMVLGDCWDLYGIITFWDSILHALFCFLVGYFAIYVFNLMNRKQIKKGLNVSIATLAVFAVGTAVTVGAIWELGEYAYDDINFKNGKIVNTQQFYKTTTGTYPTEDDIPYEGHLALRDTMKDIFVDLVGGLLIVPYLILAEKHPLKKKEENNPSEEGQTPAAA
ncbi:MAG: hypothetical protein SPH86_05595 [Eubacteriales bacterium]|nr:hypothetical protein [Eubacteriales bacterium]